MSIHDLVDERIVIRAGGLHFLCVADRNGSGPSPFSHENGVMFFTCPICDRLHRCGPSNSTFTIRIAVARKMEHEARHTAEALTG